MKEPLKKNAPSSKRASTKLRFQERWRNFALTTYHSPSQSMEKVILLTGASSGIGYATAELLARQGHKVYGAARRVEQIEPLAAVGVKALRLDVTSNESIEAAVAEIIRAEGRIDVLVNNAGYGSYGAVEDVPIDEARRQFEVNLFGLARLVQCVLPHMRRRQSGTIVNVASMGGHFTVCFGAWYHATKYALEAFSDALRMETRPFGIRVAIIEPGAIKTPWGDIAADHLEESARGGAYATQAGAAAAALRRLYHGARLSAPSVVAKAIGRAVNARRPKARYRVGFGAKPLVLLHTLLPTRWFDYFMTRAFR